MNHILMLFVCCHLSYAGTQVWTSGDGGSARALSLFNKYCSGSEDSGSDGNVNWVCKRPQRQTPVVESFVHIVETEPLTPSRKQIIFLENPGNEYKHRILVQGQIDAPLKTNVYVLPGRDTHTLSVTDDINSNSSFGKPTVFFVKSDSIREDERQANKYQSEIDNSDDSEYSAIVSAAHSFEYTKHPQPPAYVKRRRVKMTKIIREKRNYGVRRGRSPIQPISPSEEKALRKRQIDETRTVTLHYRRRNPARFGFGQKLGSDNQPEEYVPAASSYYRNPSPYQNLRPVYIKPQN